MTDVLISLLAALGVLAQLALGALALFLLAGALSPPARRAGERLRSALAPVGLWLAWAVATLATASSLWLSEGAGFAPCRLCWFQRIAMYPLVVILLVGALSRDRRAFWYAIPFPVLGLLISAHHVWIEHHPEDESAACLANGTSCAVRWIHEFGYVTIPVLAGTAFAWVIALLWLAHCPPRGHDRA